MTTLCEELIGAKCKLAVMGLGYVGLPLAVAFASKMKVIGFDVSESKVASLRDGFDPTGELSEEDLRAVEVDFTTDPASLAQACVIIVTVPTPLDHHSNPDLEPLREASRAIGRYIRPGTLVIYESTVFPGATEDICVPLIEAESGLKLGEGFSIGYSPERINPGDSKHSLQSVVKVVSGMDEVTLDTVAELYETIVGAGVHRAPDIRTAEFSKVLENTQRDINIALMNEVSIICNRAGIETREVLKAAGTKWNFLPFFPGLVGGHCIGVDPYYLTYKAEELDYKAQVILSGRSVNDSMGKLVAENVVKGLIRCGKAVDSSRVLILGVTFKEDVRDIRNSRVKDVVDELMEYEVEVIIHDPVADSEYVAQEFGVEPVADLSGVGPVDGVVAAVNHAEFASFELEDILKFFGNGEPGNTKRRGVLADVRMRYDRAGAQAAGLYYWSL